MDGACKEWWYKCKEWWYKDKMIGVSKKGYFCLFQPYILIINYRCLEDLLLIFGPSCQNTILPFSLNIFVDCQSRPCGRVGIQKI